MYIDSVAVAAAGTQLPPFRAEANETPWHWLPSTVLEKCLARFTSAPPYSAMGISLVDLTHAPADSGHRNLITYAGYRDDHQFYAASLPKIVIILAAFRLLTCFRAALRQTRETDPKKLLDEIVGAWAPIVSQRIRGRPADFPRFDRIFEMVRVGDSWSVHFSRTFMDNMVGIVANDNGAADFCIQALGFQYINGTLIHEGLYDEEKKRGLWLGGGYSKKVTWGPHGRNHGATAAAVAKLLTLLHTGNLIGTDANLEMRNLLALAQEWFAGSLFAADRPAEVIGKIGYQFKGAPMHEGAIVTRVAAGGKTLRYVAVGLNGSWKQGALLDLIVKLDDCMVARHVRPGK